MILRLNRENNKFISIVTLTFPLLEGINGLTAFY